MTCSCTIGPEALERDGVHRHQHVAEPLEGALLLLQGLLELDLGDELGADEHGADEVLLAAGGALGADDPAVLEDDVHLLIPRLQVEDAGLLLLPDELQDVADPEVLEGSLEGHGVRTPRPGDA